MKCLKMEMKNESKTRLNNARSLQHNYSLPFSNVAFVILSYMWKAFNKKLKKMYRCRVPKAGKALGGLFGECCIIAIDLFIKIYKKDIVDIQYFQPVFSSIDIS